MGESENWDDRLGEPGSANAHTPDRPGDDDAALGTQMAWRSATVLFLVAGVGALLQIATGLLTPLLEHPDRAIVISVVSTALAGVWWWCGEAHVDQRWLHAGVLLSYAILVALLSDAPTVEAELGVMYLVPLIFVALFLPSRTLFFYVGLTVGLIVWSMLRNADEGLMPGILTIAALASTASLTLYVRLELDRIARQAAKLSGRDALTGLANLRPLYERVDRGINEAARGQAGLTVVMLDLEDFKRVNDQFSHSIGDETLRIVANAIEQTVRRDELVARRGGDEFAIVTQATSDEEITSLVRRVGDAISDARVDMLPQVRSGTTFGWASYEEGDSVGQILARADRSLHEAKARQKRERWSWRARKRRDELRSDDGWES